MSGWRTIKCNLNFSSSVHVIDRSTREALQRFLSQICEERERVEGPDKLKRRLTDTLARLVGRISLLLIIPKSVVGDHAEVWRNSEGQSSTSGSKCRK